MGSDQAPGGADAQSAIKPTTAYAACATVFCGLLPATAHAAATHGPDPRAVDGSRAVSATAGRAAPWCGSVRGKGPPGLRSAPYRYHAVYLVPSDRPSRLRAVAPELQSGAFGASALLERLYGRAIRFDMGTACGRRYLDISPLRLRATHARLRRAARSRDPSALFNLIRREMHAAGLRVVTDDSGGYSWGSVHHTVNYLAWLDGPAPSRSCGQGTSFVDRRRVFWNGNNIGGKLALVFRRGRAFCGADTIRHEIGHNLGALQPQAPHTRDGAHCTDAREDTMCVSDAPSVAGGHGRSGYFDYGNDDYWDPPRGRPLGWWTLNLSWFLCMNPGCNRGSSGAGPVAVGRATAYADGRCSWPGSRPSPRSSWCSPSSVAPPAARARRRRSPAPEWTG